MSRSPLVFYLACLASLSALITAQSCNSTGTYDSCCKSPSSDKQTVTFLDKEFRVHCDAVIAPVLSYQKTPADCAKNCSSEKKCVYAHWGNGSCETKLIQFEAQSLALVLIDSADPTCPGKLGECEKDKGKCEKDKGKCEEDKGKCEKDKGKCEKDKGNCEKDKGKCEKDKGKCEKDKGKCEKDKGNCEMDKGKCEKDKGNCETDRGKCDKDKKKCDKDKKKCDKDKKKCDKDKKKCDKDKKKCDGELAKCKKKPGPFQCVDGKIETIDKAKYRHHCSQVQTRPRSHQPQVPAADARDCARKCTQSGCKFAMFVNSRACYLHEFVWNSDATRAARSGYTVLERV